MLLKKIKAFLKDGLDFVIERRTISLSLLAVVLFVLCAVFMSVLRISPTRRPSPTPTPTLTMTPTVPFPSATVPLPSRTLPPLPLIIPESTLRSIPIPGLVLETSTPQSPRVDVPAIMIGDVASVAREKDGIPEIHVTLLNFGEMINLFGWKLDDGNGNVYDFPNVTFSKQSVIYVHTDIDGGSATDLFWKRNIVLQNMLHGRMILKDPSGYVVDEFLY